MPEYTTGEHGSTVAVVTRPGRNNYYLRAWDPARGQPFYKSTGTTDLHAAKRAARLLAHQLEVGLPTPGSGPSLGAILTRYLAVRTPQKRSRTTRIEDERRAELWRTFLGRDRKPDRIREEDWARFVRERGAGTIDARGQRAERPVPVRPRTVRADLSWLRTVLRWAVKRGSLDTHPLESFDLPADENPRRPVATRDRYEAIMEEAEGLLADILPVVVWTGRRLSSVLKLTYSDIDLDADPPTVRWRAASDKGGKRTVVPIGPALAAHFDRLLRERPGIGNTPIFPAPANPEKPVDRWLASRWLRKAEKAAGVGSHDGSLWHAYRRMWATERKHLPDTDVAHYGGWKSVETLQRIYQQPDDDTLLRVATDHLELRRKRAETDTRKSGSARSGN